MFLIFDIHLSSAGGIIFIEYLDSYLFSCLPSTSDEYVITMYMAKESDSLSVIRDMTCM